LVVQVPDFNLRHQVDLVVLLGLQPVLLGLPVLAHHDHGSLQGRKRRQDQIEQDVGVGIEGLLEQKERIDRHPHDQNAAEYADERPAPSELRHLVRDTFPEGHLGFEFLVDQTAHPSPVRQPRDQGLLHLRDLVELVFEVAEKFLGTVLLAAILADPAGARPLRPVALDEIDDGGLELLGADHRAGIDCGAAEGAGDFGHGSRSYASPSTFTRKAQRSACSSIILATGFPAPCPALVSMRIITGAGPAWAAWRAAANLKECPGTTRSSWSAVVTNVAG